MNNQRKEIEEYQEKKNEHDYLQNCFQRLSLKHKSKWSRKINQFSNHIFFQLTKLNNRVSQSVKGVVALSVRSFKS
jgi:hypothetical protein